MHAFSALADGAGVSAGEGLAKHHERCRREWSLMGQRTPSEVMGEDTLAHRMDERLQRRRVGRDRPVPSGGRAVARMVDDNKSVHYAAVY